MYEYWICTNVNSLMHAVFSRMTSLQKRFALSWGKWWSQVMLATHAPVVMHWQANTGACCDALADKHKRLLCCTGRQTQAVVVMHWQQNTGACCDTGVSAKRAHIAITRVVIALVCSSPGWQQVSIEASTRTVWAAGDENPYLVNSSQWK